MTDEGLATETPRPGETVEQAPSRIASILTESRRHMDQRIDGRRIEWPRQRFQSDANYRSDLTARVTAANSPPQDAARAGISPDPIVRRTVWNSLHTSLFDGAVVAIRQLAPHSFGSITWYGQQEAHRVAYYDIHRRFGLTTFASADAELLDLQADLVASTGWWWAFENIAVMCERPSILQTEAIPDAVHGEVRLHDSRAPALQFSDGSAVNVLHGTVVPDWVMHDPTVERITTERNVEVRRCAIERIGWDTYLDQAGLALLDTADDPGNPGCSLHLFATPAGWGREGRVLLAVNGSRERDGQRRRYGLRIPDTISSALDAAGWTYGLSGTDYAQLLRRT
ncbi:MAG: DUF6745 domain-containing protein [Rhodococcus sp. (in: high G+C Gram-positive bacteria)]